MLAIGLREGKSEFKTVKSNRKPLHDVSQEVIVHT